MRVDATHKELEKRYTRLAKCSDGWSAYLQIDHQGFCVVSGTTKKRAKWFAEMLGIALNRLLTDYGVGDEN